MGFGVTNAINHATELEVGKAFYLATQTSTPQVTEEPSQQPIQNALQLTYVTRIVSCIPP